MFPTLYAILDAGIVGDRTTELAGELAGVGVELIQYRNKTGSSRTVFDACRNLARRLHGHARFIVNDRADIAALCGADGVHTGQEDAGVEEVRAVCGRELWVGVSTHNLAQVLAADRTSADYVAVGPIFSTATKENPDPVVGLEFIHQARRLTQKAIVAIGGITLANAENAFQAGADSVAVIRDLSAAEDPGNRAAAYLKIAEQIRTARN
ncbi:MAG: thiamine phosphate synthase [Candidatus Acidiferrales bacterium]